MSQSGNAQPPRKPARVRPRPVIRKRRRSESASELLQVQTESPDLMPTLDIDVYPIGGIFGTAEAPALAEPERSRIGKVGRAWKSVV